MRPELLVVYELPPFYDKVTFLYKKNYFLLICINSGKKVDESKFAIFLWLRKHIIDLHFRTKWNHSKKKCTFMKRCTPILFFVPMLRWTHINSKHDDKWFSKWAFFSFPLVVFWKFQVIVIYFLMHVYFMKTASWKVFLVCLYYVCHVLQAISDSWTYPWRISSSSHRVYWFVSVNVE